MGFESGPREMRLKLKLMNAVFNHGYQKEWPLRATIFLAEEATGSLFLRENPLRRLDQCLSQSIPFSNWSNIHLSHFTL